MSEIKLPVAGIYFNQIPDLQSKLDELWLSDKYTYITTPNPEILLRASQNDEFEIALNTSDLRLPDGIGVIFASWLLHQKKLQRWTGVDATQLLLKMADKRHSHILIIRKSTSLSSIADINDFMKKTYPNCQISFIDLKNEDIYDLSIHEQISRYNARLLICALGFPEQELLLHKLLRIIKYPSIAISSGGALDFLIGRQKRAPKIISECGFEWAWRLVTQPKRLFRIVRAVFCFPSLIIYRRIRAIFVYRKTVLACAINQCEEVLLGLYKEAGEWSFPKGGSNKGESLKITALREINEELGVTSKCLEPIYEKENIFSYNWPKAHQVNRGYKGQRVSIVVFKYMCRNEDIFPDGYEAIDSKWVRLDDVVAHMCAKRKPMAEVVVKIAKQSILRIKKS